MTLLRLCICDVSTEGYGDSKALCWFGDNNVLGTFPFDKVADTQCIMNEGESQIPVFNAEAMIHNGAGCRNAVYNIRLP